MVSPVLGAVAAVCGAGLFSFADPGMVSQTSFGGPTGAAGQRGLPASVAALNDTGFDALRHTVSRRPGAENVVLSPLSMQTCLAACLMGARGDAYTGLESALHLSALSSQAFSQEYRSLLLSLLGPDRSVFHGCALWTSGGSGGGLGQMLSSCFNAELFMLPGSPKDTLQAVNGWVNSSTKGRIPKVLDAVPAGTAFVVASACTFDGQWPSPLLMQTGDQGIRFEPEAGEPYRVTSLAASGRFSYAKSSAFEAVLLPYKVPRYGLLLIKPAQDKTIGPLVQQLSADSLLAIRKQMTPKLGHVSLPKFSINSTVNLPEFLVSRGAAAAFQPGDRFPGFASNSCLQTVIHMALIEVDEKGTKAAAATVATGGGFGGPSRPAEETFTFVADRPFVFMVYDQQTGTVLFCGVCKKPQPMTAAEKGGSL